MTTDQNATRADGETVGREQEPVVAGERDTTQQEQARREGSAPRHDPTLPDAEAEDSLAATSPDALYGQQEDQAGTTRAGAPVTGAENLRPADGEGNGGRGA